MALPVIALIGRANVGKSTLFNRVTQSRDAIVADFVGLTRDRHYGHARFGKREFIVIDTGGFEPDAQTGIYKEMANQTRQAVVEADVVLFMVDTRAGLCTQDHQIASYLRKLGKSALIVANKAEGMKSSDKLSDFYELGLGDVHAVSAAHGQGIGALLETALEKIPLPEEPALLDPEGEADRPIRLAIVGRPNVGKSTLINTWIGEERLVAFDQPGTTRDAISIPFERNEQKFELIDTAGLRRKGKVFETVEKFSVIKTLQAIETANVVLLLLDAKEDVGDQDAHIAGYALDSGKSIVVAINKWDAIDGYQREQFKRSLELRLGFLDFANRHYISARKRQGLTPLWGSILTAHQAAWCKMPTPLLTRLLQEAVQFQAPKKVGVSRPKMRYAHQGGMNPPVVVIHGTALDGVTDAYKRFLIARFRKAFNLVGTPLRLQMKTGSNPFVSK